MVLDKQHRKIHELPRLLEWFLLLAIFVSPCVCHSHYMYFQCRIFCIFVTNKNEDGDSIHP